MWETYGVLAPLVSRMLVVNAASVVGYAGIGAGVHDRTWFERLSVVLIDKPEVVEPRHEVKTDGGGEASPWRRGNTFPAKKITLSKNKKSAFGWGEPANETEKSIVLSITSEQEESHCAFHERATYLNPR